jgi:L,D-transpeptidase ErfK/SrfK
MADSESLDPRAAVGPLVLGLVAWAAVATPAPARPGGARAPAYETTTDSRHLVPRTLRSGILINVPQRLLFVFEDGQLLRHRRLRAGLGCRPPAGRYRIAVGPDDPTRDRHWLGLGRSGYGLHAAEGRARGGGSRECLALDPEDAAWLVRHVEVGTVVEVVYQAVILGQEGDAYLLEVHPDRRGGDPLRTVRTAALEAGIAQWLDWDRVRAVVTRREGVARDVTRLPGTAVAALWGVR